MKSIKKTKEDKPILESKHIANLFKKSINFKTFQDSLQVKKG